MIWKGLSQPNIMHSCPNQSHSLTAPGSFTGLVTMNTILRPQLLPLRSPWHRTPQVVGGSGRKESVPSVRSQYHKWLSNEPSKSHLQFKFGKSDANVGFMGDNEDQGALQILDRYGPCRLYRYIYRQYRHVPTTVCTAASYAPLLHAIHKCTLLCDPGHSGWLPATFKAQVSL